LSIFWIGLALTCAFRTRPKGADIADIFDPSALPPAADRMAPWGRLSGSGAPI
jgi:hypothetical protein